jgi:uncharacterized protein (DUF952 family)
MATIYHLAGRADWLAAQASGRYTGSPDDRRDGFIHFSTAAQVARSAAEHRAGQRDLLLLWVEAATLGSALRWERSAGGEEYPHLYEALPVSVVRRIDALALGNDGQHVFPSLD